MSDILTEQALLFCSVHEKSVSGVSDCGSLIVSEPVFIRLCYVSALLSVVCHFLRGLLPSGLSNILTKLSFCFCKDEKTQKISPDPLSAVCC